MMWITHVIALFRIANGLHSINANHASYATGPFQRDASRTSLVQINLRKNGRSPASHYGGVSSAGFSRASAPPGFDIAKCGEQRGSFEYDGLHRLYRLHVPCVTKIRAIVVSVHCYDACTMDDQFVPFKEAADQYGFLLLAPQGFGNSWNAGPCCGAAREHGVDDTHFLRSLVDSLNVGQGLPVFATGSSNGGFMVSLLALKFPGWLRSIAVVAGHQYADLHSLSAMPAMMVWGTDDKAVNIEGCCKNQSFAQCCCEISSHAPEQCVGTHSIFQAWSQTNTCSGTVHVEREEASGLDCNVGAACTHKTQFCTLEGAGHLGKIGKKIASQILAFFDGVV